ncbi:HAD family hydrolase [uncultured Clostridium sp.]|uniref:HAD family hydrolase n=1 Tax=uncultured Clostridium sp. TaxID=59620 RepID=UPI002609DB81|nr:HAD family hydrolase [uncultured Clostridium sp.]
MIKLIATDMDGTLLDGKGNIPKEFFEIYKELKRKNVKFVAASGRPYKTLYQNFKPISDDLYYICDNGSYIVKEKDDSKISVIDKKHIKKMISECSKLDNVVPILCGTKGAYHMACDEEMLKEIDKYYLHKHIVEDLNSVDDEIFKIAVCDFNRSIENSYPHLNHIFGDEFKVVVSGAVWMDIMNQNIDKGYALEMIQKDMGISYEETMVFGDFYNDVEMLSKAKYSFVMENANEDMKQYGNFIARSNLENGVVQAIKEYVLKE